MSLRHQTIEIEACCPALPNGAVPTDRHPQNGGGAYVRHLSADIGMESGQRVL